MSKSVAVRIVGVCCAVVLGSAPGTRVHAATTSDGKWSLTIDETPSAAFVAESLSLLDQHYHPPLPKVDWGDCCLIVGNYGGMEEFDPDDEDEFNFIRITDDVVDAGIPFAGPVVGMPGCEGSECGTVWAFLGSFQSHQHLITSLNSFIENSHMLSPLIVLNVESGTFPVFIGPYGLANGTPRVWAVTLSAAPEPASGSICLLALTLLGIQWRQRR